MGNFKISIEAIGIHGHRREERDGQIVYGCRNMGCPDCLTREFVAMLGNAGMSVSSAKFIHWPGDSEVVDDLVSGIRSGSLK